MLYLPSSKVPVSEALVPFALSAAMWRMGYALKNGMTQWAEDEQRNIAFLEQYIASPTPTAPKSEVQVYTAGYGNAHTADELFRAAQRLKAHVLDIRISPKSTRQEWNYTTLQTRFKVRYAHLHAFGNENYKRPGDGFALVNAEAGCDEVVRRVGEGQTVILLCGCKEFHKCHRSAVADVLKRRGIASQELNWNA